MESQAIIILSPRLIADLTNINLDVLKGYKRLPATSQCRLELVNLERRSVSQIIILILRGAFKGVHTLSSFSKHTWQFLSREKT
jgi:hypothetical protein